MIKISDEKVIMAVNVYAPATYEENKEFYLRLTKEIQKVKHKYKQQIKVIMGGDLKWNNRQHT